jgi:hypothetical protein
MTISAGGTFSSGLLTQLGRNAVLDPIFGDNERLDGSARTGQVVADAGFIAGGAGAMVGGGLLLRSLLRGAASGFPGGVVGAVTHGPSLLKIGAGAAILAGALGAAAGVRNLFARGAEPTPGPGPTPGPTPQPRPEPGPGTRPPHPPHTPPLPGPRPEPTPDPTPGPKPQPHPGPQPDPGQHGPVVYTVRPGEYLGHIANCFDRTWQQIYYANRETIGPNPDALYTGERLVIPGADAPGPDVRYTSRYAPGHKDPSLDCTAEHAAAGRAANCDD